MGDPSSPREGSARRAARQYESLLTTSPPLIVLIEIQTWGLIVFFMNLTEPSPRRTLIPPGWRLLAPEKAEPSPAPGMQGS
jgi:hypothetical protein